MINYEKLKLAMELANKTKGYYFRITLNSCIDNFCDISLHHKNEEDADIGSIDHLIAELQSLVKPEPKYKIGQKIWVQSLKAECDNYLSMHAFEGTVIPCQDCDFGLSEPYVRVISGNDEYSTGESFCFPTRQALIEHQIEYWTKFKIDEISASKTCPKCGMQRVADGRCWALNCDYVVTEKPCDNVVTECQHEYTFLSGFACAKCGYKKLPVFDKVMYVKPEPQHGEFYR